MKAGVRSVIITPMPGVPLGGNPRPENANLSVHDDIFANVIYLENPNQRILMIGLDLLGIKAVNCIHIKKRIQDITGIPESNIMISATHTHSGPNAPELYDFVVTDPVIKDRETRLIKAYLADLEGKVVKAAVEAARDCFECRIGFERGFNDRYSFNRRLRTKDGKIRMIFEKYELSEIKEISEPRGCPNLNIFRIDGPEGNIKAVHINYNAHPAIACGLDRAISRDYIGYLTDSLKREYGEDLVVLFTNGAEGNMVVASPETGFINSFEECRRVGEGLAVTAKTVIDRIRTTAADFNITVSEGSAQVPIRTFTQKQLEEAEEILKKATGAPSEHGCDDELSAQCVVNLSRRRGETEKIYIQTFQIGEVILIALPTETFYEIELEVADAMHSNSLYVVGLANDYRGYVPTEEAFSEGGYEVKANVDSVYEPVASKILVREILRTLQREI